ncbi:MAG TPA: YceH family protein [Acidimicrobiales bacterium]|nr:YceH family protein [Acidimicrobiales bacterium]HWI05505.1 YceH family protein [Acidimicrobiales bacterium]
MNLTPVQSRIVGCLIEKEMATPDNYPLTMNALLTACNQTTNRHPVTKLDEATVGNALQNLRAMNVVRIVYSRSNRADKFRHVLDEMLALEPEHLAVLCVLMLRGPQTSGELRTRTERLHPFASQEEVDDVLRRLAGRSEPLVARIERRPGQKESRWAHLLGPDLAEILAGDDEDEDEEGASDGRPPRIDRVAALEDAVAGLRADLERLQLAHRALVTRLGETDTGLDER